MTEEEKLLKKLKKISDACYEKKYFQSAGRINIAMDAIREYYRELQEEKTKTIL